MLLYTMLYIVLAYLMLFAALTNSVYLNNASFFFLFKYFLCQGYELSGEIALKNNHYYYYYVTAESTEEMRMKCLAQGNDILLPGFESSTSVSKTDILTNRPICSLTIRPSYVLQNLISIFHWL